MNPPEASSARINRASNAAISLMSKMPRLPDGKPGILLLSPFPFLNRHQGGAIRTRNTCEVLAGAFNLLSVDLWWPEEKCLSLGLSTQIVQPNWIHWSCPLEKPVSSSITDQHAAPFSSALTPELSALISIISVNYDIAGIWMEFTHMGCYKPLADLLGLPCVLSLHNIESEVVNSSESSELKKAIIKNKEDDIIQSFDTVLTTTSRDAEYCLKLENPPSLCIAAPNVTSLTTHSRCIDEQQYPTIHAKSRSTELKLVFVGDCRYEPNVEGLKWLFDEVLNKVDCSALPRVSVHIHGSHSEHLSHLSDKTPISCSFNGYANDLTSVYTGAHASLIPILSGGGSRLKAFEAMSKGLPIISTPKGIEGISFQNAEKFTFKFTNTQEFTDSILSLRDLYCNPSSIKQASKCLQDTYRNNVAIFEQSTMKAAMSLLASK